MANCEFTKPLLQDDDECFEENYCFMNNMLNEGKVKFCIVIVSFFLKKK
jgi:hypothetical protein